MEVLGSKKIWLIDLDGVVWRGDKYIDGSVDAIKTLVSNNREPVFFTNNSFSTISELELRLNYEGLKVNSKNILNSSVAACQLIKEGEKVLYVGGKGIREAIEMKGATPVSTADLLIGINPWDEFDFNRLVQFIKRFSIPNNFDAVVVGLAFNINFYDIALATNLILKGAKFIATNNDPTYPLQSNLEIPGAGSVVASIQASSQTAPIVAGKPNNLAVDLVRSCIGDSEIEMVVGDRLTTDGMFAKKLNANFGYVKSGIVETSDKTKFDIKFESDNLSELVKTYFK